MKTYAATLTVVLQPGAAKDAAEADSILQEVMAAHPQILGGQYVQVNGEVRMPHEVEIELPASDVSISTRLPSGTC